MQNNTKDEKEELNLLLDSDFVFMISMLENKQIFELYCKLLDMADSCSELQS